ncbi:hypothetical protein WKU33_17785 [Oceanobacillus sp. HCA-5259]|uniref:hypothetical protein n=1 Tax=Oceanobacillus sp. HCA-5259 TaxID=3134661 RepID=UPI0030C616E7
MKLLKRKTLIIGMVALLMVSFLSLAPVNLIQNGNSLQLVANKTEAADEWVYVDTAYKSTTFNDVASQATIAFLGSLLAIAAPYTSPLSSFVTVIVTANMKTVYFKDVQYVRMAGTSYQTRHVITLYSDPLHRNKRGETVTIITNDTGGPKSINPETE